MTVFDPYQVLQVAPGAEQEVIQAAFRALALKYHPDRDSSSYGTRRMAQLNEAYALVRDASSRSRWERAQRQATWANGAAPNGKAPPPRSSSAGTRLEFGRYSGWTLRDLARHDTNYLRWLSRHASGLRYRTEIYQILGRMGTSAA